MPFYPCQYACWASLAVLALMGCAGHERLSTDLANASLEPVLWEPKPDSFAPADPDGPPPNACALRLRDRRTDIEYQLQRHHARRVEARPSNGAEGSQWHQVGDYLRIFDHEPVGRASSWVRIECGSWKVLGLVSSQP
jgi:hypothetical protein